MFFSSLDRFLHDFVELMHLMHWLHQSISQKETNKYLNPRKIS